MEVGTAIYWKYLVIYLAHVQLTHTRTYMISARQKKNLGCTIHSRQEQTPNDLTLLACVENLKYEFPLSGMTQLCRFASQHS